MASDNDDAILIRTNLRLRPATLQTIVAKLKQTAGCDEHGRYHVDTAEGVGELISRFLLEKDFDAFADDLRNYQDLE